MPFRSRTWPPKTACRTRCASIMRARVVEVANVLIGELADEPWMGLLNNVSGHVSWTRSPATEFQTPTPSQWTQTQSNTSYSSYQMEICPPALLLPLRDSSRYVKHGFLSSTSYSDAEKVTDFMRYSLESYSSSALPFVTDTHHVVSRTSAANSDQGLDRCLQLIAQLDALYDAMTLNHVSKRASRAQGVALLTLFSKGFIRPQMADLRGLGQRQENIVFGRRLFGRTAYRSAEVGNSSGKNPRPFAHLLGRSHCSIRPVSWSAPSRLFRPCCLTRRSPPSERSQHLHLFLHARGLLSAAIRMNVLGPYAAQQLLLHVVRPLVDSEIARCKSLQTGMPLSAEDTCQTEPGCNPESTVDGPATTWPLGRYSPQGTTYSTREYSTASL